MKRESNISIVVPFYNEGQRLATLIQSLDQQENNDVGIVFVDNNSTDESQQIIKDSLHSSNLKGTIITQKKQGKLHAVRTGVNHVLSNASYPEQSWIIILDADIHFETNNWLREIRDTLSDCEYYNPKLGYIHGPLSYSFSLATQLSLPGFLKAHNTYDYVINNILMPQIGWFGASPNAAFRAAPLQAIINSEIVSQNMNNRSLGISEQDIRISLEFLRRGYQGVFQKEKVFYSGRRVEDNPHGWYGDYLQFRESGKNIREYDINQHQDLDPHCTHKLFRGRAKKIVVRNLTAMIAMDNMGIFTNNVERFFDTDVQQIIEISKSLSRAEEDLFIWDTAKPAETNIREQMLSKIADLKPTQEMIEYLVILMQHQHAYNSNTYHSTTNQPVLIPA